MAPPCAQSRCSQSTSRMELIYSFALLGEVFLAISTDFSLKLWVIHKIISKSGCSNCSVTDKFGTRSQTLNGEVWL